MTEGGGGISEWMEEVPLSLSFRSGGHPVCLYLVEDFARQKGALPYYYISIPVRETYEGAAMTRDIFDMVAKSHERRPPTGVAFKVSQGKISEPLKSRKKKPE